MSNATEREKYTLETMPPMFGTDILAEVLDLSPAWCERARVTGTGPKFVKLNGAVRYTSENTREYVREQTRSSTSETPETPA